MNTRFEAIIAGGSVGGLATAHTLSKIGAEVTVFERSPNKIQTRGAGVVMQPEVEYLLEQIGSSAAAVSVPLHERQRMDRRGNRQTYSAPQLMTSWDALYRSLRESMPDVAYNLGSKLTDVVEQDGRVTARFADGQEASADLLIGADGVGSAARAAVGVPGAAAYGGYVAWRGLEPETALPGHIVDVLNDKFTFFATPGLQFLSYLVPGANGEIEPGHRRVNWVWYMNLAEEVLPSVFTSRDGRTYRAFLPAGQLVASTQEALRDVADQHLPKILAELAAASNIFMQPIFDVPYTRMRAGRTLLLGDAAGTVRPHTASGTSKAFGDAIMLGHALDGWDAHDDLPEGRLDLWESERGRQVRDIARHGISLAESSMLGTRGSPRFLDVLGRSAT